MGQDASHRSRGAADVDGDPASGQVSARRVEAIISLLADAYPTARLQLNFSTPLELAVATILSARSTDDKINEVTPALFARYRSAEDYAAAELADLEKLVHATGFFHTKAATLQSLGAALVATHGGQVPDTLEALVALPGIGRKTANVILGNAFGVPGIVIDTHFSRLARRWEWTRESDATRIEKAVARLVPREEWISLSNRAILHGRQVCHARKPACGACPLSQECPSFGAGPTSFDVAAKLVRGPEAARLVKSAAQRNSG